MMSDKLIYYIQTAGSLLVVIGSVFRLFAFESYLVPVIFSTGALSLIVAYYLQYHKLEKDSSQRIQRLYRMMLFISLLLGIAAYLMIIKDERWVVLVLLYAVTTIFLSFREEDSKKEKQ